MSETEPVLTAERIGADVAELVGCDVADIAADANLFDLGLDSVRLMALIEKWRTAGAAVEFPDLAERPELGHWIGLLSPAGSPASSSTEEEA